VRRTYVKNSIIRALTDTILAHAGSHHGAGTGK